MRMDLATKEDYQEYLGRWDWQWWVTLNFSNKTKIGTVDALIKRWRLEFLDKEKLPIAYMGALLRKPMHHVHLFMLGRDSKGRTLRDVEIASWEREFRCDTVIKKIYDLEGLIGYYYDQNVGTRTNEPIHEYGTKLLKSLMRMAA